ncbi:hypothetical protein ABH935_001548 [Catenulispora sp. GAS73]|uniref:RICIN domain-containing protein n=1 Tax=Catenulispora sp. GAS73 TaxID=3156269 RepID=UPI00351448FE
MPAALKPSMRNRKWYALLVGLLASIALCASTVTASASASDDSVVWFTNDHSGLCMSVPGDNIHAGAVVNQYTCTGPLFPDQLWYLDFSSSHPGWFYILPHQNPSLCVTYVPGSTAQLTLQNCGPSAANGNVNTELWSWSNTGPGSTGILTMQGWAMSVPGANTGVAPINIYPYGHYPDQSWFVSDTTV